MDLRVGDSIVAVDVEGYLISPSDWNDDIANELALQERIVLTEDHWSIIRFMREFYEEHQVAADVRHVTKHMSEQMDGARNSKALLFTLFPYGYVKQACKIAGMKKPRGWSTG